MASGPAWTHLKTSSTWRPSTPRGRHPGRCGRPMARIKSGSTNQIGMLPLNLPDDPRAPLQILCLGAHSDDIEIGCGGTILQLTRAYPAAQVRWVVLSAGDGRRDE